MYICYFLPRAFRGPHLTLLVPTKATHTFICSELYYCYTRLLITDSISRRVFNCDFIVTLNNVTSRAYGRVITYAMHASLPLNCNTTVGKTKARKVEPSVRHISNYQKPVVELMSLS